MVPDDPLWAIQAGESPKYLANYQALAKDLKICLVPGTIIEKHSGPNNTTLFYNVAYFISNDGSILASYRKKNIWHPERPHLTSSALEHHVAIDTPIGRVGMLICWDLAFPEAFRELIADGAQIVIVPTYCELQFIHLTSTCPSQLILTRDSPRCLSRGSRIQPRLRSSLPRIDHHSPLL